MNGAAVFLIAFFTSIVTSIGTLYLSEKLDLFGETEAKAETVQVPDLAGLSETDAVNNLKNSGLLLMIGGRKASPTAAEGTVLSQSFPAGQKVDKGSSIRVTLAIAMPKVPSVVDKSLEEASELLKKAGYLVKDEPGHHKTIPKGHIISQSPEPEAALEKGKSVTVKVSDGTGEIEVPKLIGFRYTKAKSDLEKLGLKAKIRWVNLAERSSSIVLSQTPKAGKMLSPDSEVEIVINRE